MHQDAPQLIRSRKGLRISIQGYAFSIEIYRLETEPTWTLEVSDHTGTSHVWDAPFTSDRAARDTAIYTLETQGPAGFTLSDTVIPFRRP